MKIERVAGEGRKRLEVALKNLDGKVAKAGWFEGAKYPSGVQVAYVAVIQEYGYAPKNIPPRPFMRPTVANRQTYWAKIAESEVRKILKGTSTTALAMNRIGEQAAGDIRKAISLVTQPALAESTVLARIRKHSKLSQLKRRFTEREALNTTKPLVDTGVLLGTVTHEVSDA